MSSARASILLRPVKSTSQANIENQETEHQRELAYLQMKRQKYVETENFLRQSRKGESSAEERQRIAEEYRLSQAKLLEAKHEQEESQRRADREIAGTRGHLEESAAEYERRMRMVKLEEARRVMETNRQLAESRRQRLRQERDEEHRVEEENLRLNSARRAAYR